ncbi:UPF0301 protein pc1755-like isoform X1 [Zingiber officinale]|uniref:UPF0301 protein pc1755-like isoform X1 n=1 Tax=Zingiber officinale TaxID=94328 RepID=UPI001C4C1808|nr:UPF0301 protein pc1755-like isoform X1 [Zingiber officinale]
MDVWALNLKGAAGIPFLGAASKCERGGRLVAVRRAGGGIDVGVLVRTRRWNSSAPAYRSFVVTASGGKKRSNRGGHSSSGKGENDPSIPEEDGLDVTTPQYDDKSKTNDCSRKPQFTLSNWRDVRANLVAKEQEHLLDTDGQGITSNEQPQMLSSKWAHPIPMLESGCVLLATEKLDGVPMFERTVILLLSLGSRDPRDRPFGVILNRPLRRKIKHMNPSNPHLATIFSDCSVHCGGPVEANMFLLKSSDGLLLPGFGEAVSGVYFGSRNNLDDAAVLVKKGAFMPRDFIFFEGYSGWEFDQLLDELESEYWVVASCSSHLVHQVYGTSSSNLWEEILQLMGGQYSELSRKPKQDDP